MVFIYPVSRAIAHPRCVSIPSVATTDALLLSRKS